MFNLLWDCLDCDAQAFVRQVAPRNWQPPQGISYPFMSASDELEELRLAKQIVPVMVQREVHPDSAWRKG
jgi:hypothetical protein